VTTNSTPSPRNPSIVKFLEGLPERPQLQEDLTNQIEKLYAVAVRLGLYDAADFLRNVATRK